MFCDKHVRRVYMLANFESSNQIAERVDLTFVLPLTVANIYICTMLNWTNQITQLEVDKSNINLIR